MTITTFGSVTAEPHAGGVRIGVTDTPVANLSPRDAVALASFLSRQRWGETRTGFRVPIHMLISELQHQLKVTLVHQGVIYDCEPVDLSLTGILVRCSTLDVGANTRLTARILFEDHLAKLDAEVVRSQSGIVALHFCEAMRGAELNPPRDLIALFRRLEQLYLRGRNDDG